MLIVFCAAGRFANITRTPVGSSVFGLNWLNSASASRVAGFGNTKVFWPCSLRSSALWGAKRGTENPKLLCGSPERSHPIGTTEPDAVSATKSVAVTE